MNSVIIEKIRKEIEKLDITEEVTSVGRVVSVGDGVAEIEGLTEAMMSEMIIFEKEGTSLEDSLKNTASVFGLVLNLEEELVKVVILGESDQVVEGMVAKGLGRVLSVPVGEQFVGRVVNSLGEPVDGKGAIVEDAMYPIEREAYGVIDRKSVDTPVHTGIKTIDALTPIGRGQRQLIIGDRFTGKTTIAIDTILNQKNEPEETRPICIYVAIGQKESKVAQMVELLRERGALEYTIVVSATAGQAAPFQFIAPFTGVTIGEYFMEKGKDVVIFYDDLSKHAVAYRQMSLLLRRPPGREAYPGDIFYLHSRLLERAAKLSDAKGGGSITALPIIETQEGDVSAYISTNVISITDGQVFLDIDIFNKGVRPAMDSGVSVSRVGSSAQTKAMKKVAGKISVELAQFRDLEAFMQFSQDLDEDTKKKIEYGQRLVETLKQDKNKPIPFENQAMIIYAAVNGYLNDIDVASIAKFEEQFLEYLRREHATLLSVVRDEKILADTNEQILVDALKKFKETHTFSE